MNTTILGTIGSLFDAKGNEDKEFTFSEIFTYVESLLLDKWLENNSQELPKNKILTNKMGETYKLLTVDGRFIRHEDGTWLKRKTNQIA